MKAISYAVATCPQADSVQPEFRSTTCITSMDVDHRRIPPSSGARRFRRAAESVCSTRGIATQQDTDFCGSRIDAGSRSALRQHPAYEPSDCWHRIYDFRDVNVRMMTYNRQQNEVEVLLIRNVDTLVTGTGIARILWKNQHRRPAATRWTMPTKPGCAAGFPGPLLGWIVRRYLYLGQPIQPSQDRPNRPHRLLPGIW